MLEYHVSVECALPLVPQLQVVRRLNTMSGQEGNSYPPARTYVDVMRHDERLGSAPPYELIDRVSSTTAKHVRPFMYDPAWPMLVDIEIGGGAGYRPCRPEGDNVWIWRAHRDPGAYRGRLPPGPEGDEDMYRGWPWPYLSQILQDVIEEQRPHTFVGLESVPPELFGIEFSTADLIAHERGVEAWAPVLRTRVLEMIRAVDLEWAASERQPDIAHFTHEHRDYYAREGINLEDLPGDISKRVRVLTMDEYRAEVGDEVWRAETWGEDVPEPVHIPWEEDW